LPLSGGSFAKKFRQIFNRNSEKTLAVYGGVIDKSPQMQKLFGTAYPHRHSGRYWICFHKNALQLNQVEILVFGWKNGQSLQHWVFEGDDQI